jgi:hypothetical protein
VKLMQPPGAEIIVLDSDGDDDDTPAACTKRKAEENHAGGSSDVEVVEAVSRPSHDASSSRKKTKVKSGSKLFDMDIDDLMAFTQDDALHFSEFGKPRLLVPAKDNVPPFAEDQNLQSASSSHSDDQRPVVAPATVSADPDDSQHSLLETQGDSSDVFPTCSTQAGPSNVIEIDDEWGTGDDELFQTNEAEVDGVLELADEDEIEAVLKLEDEPPDNLGDNLDWCPFCGINLISFCSLVRSRSPYTIIVFPHELCIRTFNHISLPVATRSPPRIFRSSLLSRPVMCPHHPDRRRVKGQYVAMPSRYSCPRARRMTRGRKPRLSKIATSGQRKLMEVVERLPFTRSYKACPSPSMLSATAKFLA